MYYNLPEAPPHMVCSTVYAYTSVSLDLCVSVHVGVGGGLSFPQVIQDVHDPKRGLDSWARRLRVFEGKRCPRSPVCVQEPSRQRRC